MFYQTEEPGTQLPTYHSHLEAIADLMLRWNVPATYSQVLHGLSPKGNWFELHYFTNLDDGSSLGHFKFLNNQGEAFATLEELDMGIEWRIGRLL